MVRELGIHAWDKDVVDLSNLIPDIHMSRSNKVMYQFLSAFWVKSARLTRYEAAIEVDSGSYLPPFQVSDIGCVETGLERETQVCHRATFPFTLRRAIFYEFCHDAITRDIQWRMKIDMKNWVLIHLLDSLDARIYHEINTMTIIDPIHPRGHLRLNVQKKIEIIT